MFWTVLAVILAFALVPVADLLVWEVRHRIAERQAREWIRRRGANN